MELITAYLTIIKNLKELITGRLEVNRKMFEDHIDPIYNDLREVIEDYTNIFKTAHSNFADPSVPIVYAVDAILQDREKFKMLRSELRTYATALYSEKIKYDLRTFATAVKVLLERNPSEIWVSDPSTSIHFYGEIITAICNDYHYPSSKKDRVILEEKYEVLKLIEARTISLGEDPNCFFTVRRDRASKICIDYLNFTYEKWQELVSSYYTLRIKCLK